MRKKNESEKSDKITFKLQEKCAYLIWFFFSCINRYKTKQSNSHKLNAQLVNVVTSFNMNYLSFFLFLNIYRGIYLKVFKLKIYRFINNMSVIAYTILKDLRLIAGYRFIIFTQKI